MQLRNEAPGGSALTWPFSRESLVLQTAESETARAAPGLAELLDDHARDFHR
jgi:hypothetical protein